MAKAYSSDLRTRVLDEILAKTTHEKIAKMFKIGVATVRRWAKLYKENGNLNPKKPVKTRSRKVNYDKIAECLMQKPDQTLKELGTKFGISAFAVCKIMKKLDFTYKKTVFVRGKKRGDAKRVLAENSENT